MDFGFAQYVSIELKEKSHFITLLSDQLKIFFKDKDYGESLKSIAIGIVCVSPPFEPFFKLKKPRYTKDKAYVDEGFTVKIDRCLEYSIKIDFETIKNGDIAKCEKFVAREVFQSLKVLDEMKNKIKDFDISKFKEDLESYLKERELL